MNDGYTSFELLLIEQRLTLLEALKECVSAWDTEDLNDLERSIRWARVAIAKVEAE